jgi:hypothetical protein
MKSRRQAGIGVVGLLGVLFILMFWGSLTRPVLLRAATTAPKLRTTTVGQTVRVGALRIRVTQMTCGYVELAGLPPADRGQYCVADLTATNLRSYPDWLYDAEQRLSVATGASFSGFGLGNQLWDDQVQPGQTVTTRLSFDLPQGTTPVQMRLQGYADQDSERKDIVTIDLRR